MPTNPDVESEPKAGPKADLFLLEAAFEDPKYPGQRFHCRHCVVVEGLLAAFPVLQDHLDIHRVAFPRPRPAVIALVGEANQGLPVLVLPEGVQTTQATGEADGRTFVSGAEPIAAALAELYAIPAAHP